jgi:hypothetical protein
MRNFSSPWHFHFVQVAGGRQTVCINQLACSRCLITMQNFLCFSPFISKVPSLLYIFYEYYYHFPSYSLGSIFIINVHTVLLLYDNVIYVLLSLRLCFLIVCLCMTTLTEVFPCFFLSSKANVRVKPEKTGHGLHSS